jgi:hypothetical protein
MGLSTLYKVTLPAGLIVLGVVLATVGVFGFVAAGTERTKLILAVSH